MKTTTTCILTTAISCLLTVPATAQTTQKLNIDGATVFQQGAELSSSARVSLAKGETEILFTNVAGNVNTQSLVVGASGGVAVASATFQNNYLDNTEVSPRTQGLKDSIEQVQATAQTIDNRIATIKEQIAVLKDNHRVAGNNNGLSVAELEKLLALVNTRMEGLLDQQSKQDALKKKNDERLAHLQRQLAEEQQKGYQPGGRLLVKFYSKEATTSTIAITYVVPNAGWTPVYDIMASDVNSPVHIYYKANLYQNSGVKWNNVHLSLSTGNPTEGAQAPVISPWYLSFYSPIRPLRAMAMYKRAETADTMVVEDPVSGGASAMAAPATMNDYVSIDNSGVSTSFDIDVPYTVPSDGQQHVVAIKQYDVHATYRYFAVPKLDQDAFLQAQITHWEDLNLLPGQSNIFYEGTYVGQGFLDPHATGDTMNISLGRDKKVVVKRERDTQHRSTRTIGSNTRETYAYTISVRNTRKEPINIILQDQLPVSNDKDIVVEDKETGNADYNETTGLLQWQQTIQPSATQSTTFGYTIKYPKGKRVSGL